MARGKTIYISGTGKPKPGQGIKVWGPRRKYSPVRRNYSTTDRANFTARIVRNITMEPYSGDVGVDTNFVYMFINVYKELYDSEYKPLIQKMYEEFMIKKYTCTMSLDGSSSLVTVNMPQSTFYCAQDRNGINAEGGFKKPQDYASVYSKPINYYSPFKTSCGLSVSGIQEASSFISCDMFKPQTGLWGFAGDSNLPPNPNTFTYSQNQTYSQYMFKPVILCAVKVPTTKVPGPDGQPVIVQPSFTVELKIDLVGRGIRALKNDTSNLTVSNAAKPEDISAGKIAFDYSGNSMTGTLIPPINTSLAFTQNGTYTVGDSSGGYPISSASLISVSVPDTKKSVDAIRLYDRSTGTIHTVPIVSLISQVMPSDGLITGIDGDTYVMSTSEGGTNYVAYLTAFESGACTLCLNFTTCQVVGDGTYQIKTRYTSDNADQYWLIPKSYLSGFGAYSSNALAVMYGTLQNGTFEEYVSSVYGFYSYVASYGSYTYQSYYGGVTLSLDLFDLSFL